MLACVAPMGRERHCCRRNAGLRPNLEDYATMATMVVTPIIRPTAIAIPMATIRVAIIAPMAAIAITPIGSAVIT